jgi:hypothetical protein
MNKITKTILHIANGDLKLFVMKVLLFDLRKADPSVGR